MKIAFIFPGQGSQKVNMGHDFFNGFDVCKTIFEKANALLGYRLSDIMFSGPKEKLDLTQNSQLAIFVNSIAILQAIYKKYPHIKPSVVAGLSLGEYCALYASHRLDFECLLDLIKKRAYYMDLACKESNGAMAVIFNLKLEEIQKYLSDIADVWIANINTDNQIVISGKRESVEKAVEVLKQKGAKRALLLDVQGAFHSPMMMSAQNKLKDEIFSKKFQESSIELFLNVDAKNPKNVLELQNNLIKQISSPVKWADIIKEIDNKADIIIEIGSKSLTNMNRKMNVEAKCISIEKIEDLKELDECNF
jgi:[acyl-carrier-protein] S-malonyltransferase